MSIRLRITIGYLILFALMVLVQLYQISLVQRMQSINQHLFEVNYVAGQRSVQLHNNLLLIDDVTRRFFVTGDRRYADQLQDFLTSFGNDVHDLQGLGLSDSENEEFARLEELWRELFNILRPYLKNLNPAISPDVREDVYWKIGQMANQTKRLIPVTAEGLEARVAESRAANQTVQAVSWAAAGLVLVVGLTVALLTVRSITRPINQLSRGARELAGGDFSFQVDDTGRDEVAELARNFNVMVRRLNELDQLKSDFVSHVSHELKAPLASMQETTALLLEEIPGQVNSKQTRLLELNLKCGKRLSRMINNLLDLSRLESGAMEYEFLPHDLSALVGEAAAEMEGLASERQRSLSVDGLGQSVVATCDAGKILQVLRNLIDNALNFSPPETAVQVSLKRCDAPPAATPDPWRQRILESPEGYGLVSVSDQGPGVEDDHKERIFDKFHQVRRGRKVTGQGVGLGLAISRTIVEAHEGALWVEDNQPAGSVFRLLLPLGEKRAKKLSSLI